MTRKMLKEEKELRKYLEESVTDDYSNEFITIRKEWNLLITALVRAVREDTMKNHLIEYPECHKATIEAAIRGRK